MGDSRIPIVANFSTHRDAISAYVDMHLLDRDLDTDGLCRAFSMSRTSLYRLLANLGGGRQYIYRNRLKRAFFPWATDRRIASGLARLPTGTGMTTPTTS